MQRLIAVLLLLTSSLTAAAPPAGQLDPTFGIGGEAILPFDLYFSNYDEGSSVAADAQGRLYLVGSVLSSPMDRCLGIARFSSEGILDVAGYGEGGRRCHEILADSVRLHASDAAVLANGMLVVAGVDVIGHHPAVCRFDPEGDLDTTFGGPAAPGCAIFEDVRADRVSPTGGPHFYSYIDIAIDHAHADRIFVSIQRYEFSVMQTRLGRMTSEGSIVPFGKESTVSIFPDEQETFPSDLAFGSEGSLWLGGGILPSSNHWKFVLARINPDSGLLDPAFNGTGFRTIAFGDYQDIPLAVVPMPDGNIAIAGGTVKPGMRPAVALLTPSGAYVESFNGGQPFIYDPCMEDEPTCAINIYAMAMSAVENGKLLIGGYVMDQNNEFSSYTLRLRQNGTPDSNYTASNSDFPGFAPIPGPGFSAAMLIQGARAVLGGSRDMGGERRNDFSLIRLSDGRIFRDGYE